MPGVGDGQGGLACCDSWGHKESDMAERLNWADWRHDKLLPSVWACGPGEQERSYNVFYGLGLEVCYSCCSCLVTKSALFSARRVYKFMNIKNWGSLGTVHHKPLGWKWPTPLGICEVFISLVYQITESINKIPPNRITMESCTGCWLNQ